MTTFRYNEKIDKLLEGHVNESREYGICLGQSQSSKGVMFVLYAHTKPTENFRPNNPYTYMGQLADDFERAVEKARERCGSNVLQVWDDETFKDRKADVFEIPFGKHKGETLADVVDTDPNYVFWLANNATVKGKYFNEALTKYREIAKDMITEENEAKENAPLELEAKVAIKELKIGFTKLVFIDEYNDKETWKTTLWNDNGDRFIYTGKKLGEKDETIQLKCKVTKTWTYLGRTYNKLNLR